MRANINMKNKGTVQIIISCRNYKKDYEYVKKIGKIKYRLPMINAYVVEVNENRIEDIIQSEGVFAYEMDAHITAQMKRVSDIIELRWAHDRRIYGNNIGVAIVDTGIWPHEDFTNEGNRIVGFYDVINGKEAPYDDNGHGTHVAGIVGGSGKTSGGHYIGIAPKCKLIGVKVLNEKGDGNISDVLAGLQWVVNNKEKYNIRIVNISVGATTNDDIDESSMLVKGVNAVWDEGIVVVVAAGNNGPNPMSISIPGISRKVITVGSSDDNYTVDVFGSKKKDYSGRGPTSACIKKPDVIAPGSNIVSCGLDRNVKLKNTSSRNNYKRIAAMYTRKSGTSMSTPIVSGAIALLLSKYPRMNNRDVKLKLRTGTLDLGFNHPKQGWGLINIPKLLS